MTPSVVRQIRKRPGLVHHCARSDRTIARFRAASPATAPAAELALMAGMAVAAASSVRGSRRPVQTGWFQSGGDAIECRAPLCLRVYLMPAARRGCGGGQGGALNRIQRCMYGTEDTSHIVASCRAQLLYQHPHLLRCTMVIIPLLTAAVTIPASLGCGGVAAGGDGRGGTQGFRAPEVLLGSHCQTCLIDIWSTGYLHT